MPMPAPLARAHGWARSQPALARFTLLNRLLLAMAFLPTGLVKATGQRFTSIPVSNPIGFFFEAMYQTGPYWHFIGLVQIAAAVCLLIPSTATLGAVLFLPIGVSIVLITVGMGFTGTGWIAGGMLLSVIYLLCWDGDRIWAAGAALLHGEKGSRATLAGAGRVEKLGWAGGGLTGMALLLITRGFLPGAWTGPLLVAGAASFLLVVAGGAGSMVRARRG